MNGDTEEFRLVLAGLQGKVYLIAVGNTHYRGPRTYSRVFRPQIMGVTLLPYPSTDVKGEFPTMGTNYSHCPLISTFVLICLSNLLQAISGFQIVYFKPLLVGVGWKEG